MDIKIRRQKRRSMMMRRTHAGIEVYIPHWMRPQDRRVQAFIAEGLEKLPPAPERLEQTPAGDIRALVRQWAAHMGLSPGRITLRDMQRKWGSCSSKDNITLNTALRFLPRRLVEYVVVHELVHLLVFNHGPEFRDMMTHFLPDWEARENDLRDVRL